MNWLIEFWEFWLRKAEDIDVGDDEDEDES